MTAFKAYASRALTTAGLGDKGERRWSRHGSTRWLNTDDTVQRAIRYTVDERGEPMAAFEARGS